ncbi:gustatory receptor 68a [Drosophila elegans]|uniref:gustatory receptor 68a n=1 Tax=Drosophila elegans TaxID=30023 RepID=UPI0007E6151B|nr:gustatory receptor 68a [Drosophila elegans]
MKIVQDIGAIARPSQIYALLPFYAGNEEESFRFGRLGRWYGRLVALTILISSLFFGHDVLFASSEYRLVANNQGDTEEINRTIETLLCIGSYTMMVLSSVLHASRHFRTLRDIAKIDEYLVISGFRENYSCRNVSILVGTAALGVLAVAFYYIHFRSGINYKKQVILLLVYSLQLLYSTVFAIYLRTLLRSLAQRIGFLNQRLDAFCLQENVADTMGLSYAWVLAETITMAMICSACDCLASEANSTVQILARVYGKSRQFQNLIDKFLTKSIKQDLQFTAYGFFAIDNSTLFKIFSAVTTYLVILIQFKQLEDSKVDEINQA